MTINAAKCDAMCFGRDKSEKVKIGSAELSVLVKKIVKIRKDWNAALMLPLNVGSNCGCCISAVAQFYRISAHVV